MNFKTPSYWYQSPDAAPRWVRVLAPLGQLYGLAGRVRAQFATPSRADIPVICIGNLVAGGSGKTPTAIAVMRLIKEHGIARNPCFLTRGYGGRLRGPVFVSDHHYLDVGDESLLLSRVAPVIVSKDRVAGAKLAVLSGHDLIVMDDGFQNPRLHKDVSFIVVDGKNGFGNGYLIPFGPLRENLQDGLTRAHAVINIGGRAPLSISQPVINAHIEAQSSLKPGTAVLGFCGLGQPEKFRQSLIDHGYEVVGFEIFADHHPYTEADIQRLRTKASLLNAQLITTEKDLCRLPESKNIHILSIQLVFDQADSLLALLKGKSS